MDISNGASQRPVVRAACLNCRSAKRKCDGASPVCGPCQSRGIEEGGCNFVSSKRGGPRYKGVKGADAAKVKADKDKAKEAAKSRSKQTDVEADDSAARSTYRSDSGSTPSRKSGSPPTFQNDSKPNLSTQWKYGSMSSQHSPGAGSSANSMSVYGSPFGIVPINPQMSNAPNSQARMVDGSYSYAHDPPQQYSQNHPQPHSSSLSGQTQPSPAHSISLDNGSMSDFQDAFGPQTGPLSFANLELWQKIQDGSGNQDVGAFADFYSRLENLPKAGVLAHDTGPSVLDPLDVLMDWEGGEVGNNIQDNELGVRNLLSDYYEKVYPSCPVLLPPGNLPSLAFYFSGKGPCGLFAAISAVVSLHLSPHEASKTLKNSQAAMARLEGFSSKFSPSVSVPIDRLMTTAEIAAYHAKTSELILHRYEETKATCFIDTTCPNPFAGMDEELITIEAAAAHTLLCHYYYGSGKALGHHRAYKHAVEAWNLVQKLDLRSASWQESTADTLHHRNASRPFSSDLKLEWGKRVYWASYAAATVMSCTGGFQPFGNPKDEVMDLKLRPHLEHDVAAWGIMVRGAQQVSRTYRLLYDLEQLRAKLAAQGGNPDQHQLHQAAMERQAIFNAMLKLDSEIGTYTRFDPSWRRFTSGQEASEGPLHPVEDVEKLLARSLKIAGRLMTSGALIILHRAQAFSNARVFMQPQCGIPEAVRVHKPIRHDAILHRASLDDGYDGNASGEHASDRCAPGNGSFNPPSDARSKVATMGATSSPTPSHVAQHPFLVDRFAGGPFEPTHSLERCRFAASAMINTLPSLMDQAGTPKLPPYSACSYVLCAYATLMLTLLLQVHGEETGLQYRNGRDGGAEEISSYVQSKVSELRKQLEMHRAPVKDIITVLHRFAVVWPRAVEYQEEVSTLLAANEII